MSSIFDFVKGQRTNYRSQIIKIADGHDYSHYQTLRTIELYHNSRFETGKKDSLGREKPFCNISKFRVNVAVRATGRAPTHVSELWAKDVCSSV